jgi:hypothetical protein
MPGEAKDLISQLPSLLQPRLSALPAGPDKLVTRQSIESEVGQRLDVGLQRAAEILSAIGASVSECVTPGQIDDVRAPSRSARAPATSCRDAAATRIEE